MGVRATPAAIARLHWRVCLRHECTCNVLETLAQTCEWLRRWPWAGNNLDQTWTEASLRWSCGVNRSKPNMGCRQAGALRVSRTDRQSGVSAQVQTQGRRDSYIRLVRSIVCPESGIPLETRLFPHTLQVATSNYLDATSSPFPVYIRRTWQPSHHAPVTYSHLVIPRNRAASPSHSDRCLDPPSHDALQVSQCLRHYRSSHEKFLMRRLHLHIFGRDFKVNETKT